MQIKTVSQRQLAVLHFLYRPSQKISIFRSLQIFSREKQKIESLRRESNLIQLLAAVWETFKQPMNGSTYARHSDKLRQLQSDAINQLDAAHLLDSGVTVNEEECGLTPRVEKVWLVEMCLLGFIMASTEGEKKIWSSAMVR